MSIFAIFGAPVRNGGCGVSDGFLEVLHFW
jgi:hypothetical protein